MKNLLYKELRLCVPVQTWIFVALSALILIPSWPSLVSFIYPVVGMGMIFSLATANRDLLYTSTLPLRKKDVVKGKALLVVFLEILSILIALPCGILRQSVLLPLMSPESSYPELGVNLATFGFAFFLFGSYNALFFPLYYKKPEAKVVVPFLVPPFVVVILMGILIGVFSGVPGANEFINDFSSWTSVLVQSGILLFGIVWFVLFTLLGTKKGQKAFQNVDL